MTFQSNFILLPVTVPSAGPTIARDDVISILPVGGEIDAQAHWDFNTDSDSLIDLVNGNTLTATFAPTYDANGLTTTSGIGHGLESAIVDAASKTQCAIFRWDQPNPSVRVVFGTGGGINADGGVLAHLFLSGGSMSWRVSLLNTSSSSAQLVPEPSGLVRGTSYVFGAMVERPAASGVSTVYLGDASGSHVATFSNTKTVNARNYAVGNHYYDALAANTVRMCEYIIFNRVLTVAELDGVYIRSVQRMRDKGITVF